MRIGFLGTGRMGTELVKRLLGAGHEVTVWNRTAAKAEALVDAGATQALEPAAAVADQDLVMTALFGPAAVAAVVVDAALLPEGTVWANITTESPAQVSAEAAWAGEHGIRYVHSPVVGTLAPARAGKLGVYVGGDDAEARTLVASAAAAYADPDRLVQVETAGEAATAKLIANLALVTTAQGVAEALRLGAANGVNAEKVLGYLDKTSLQWMADFKRDFILGRDTSDAQFTTNAIAKDALLMVHSAAAPLPATTAGLESLLAAQRKGLGEHDFSAIMQAEA